MDKFRNKYRIQSARWQNWDYGWNGAYFITICTANRECFFGDIVDGEMELSGIGEMADKFLLEIPQRYAYAILDEFVVHQNISLIFNWYTGRVTFESRKINENFAWQPRFHDHVIRDMAEYYRIKNYIMNNPKNWNNDAMNNQ